ncbi:MAG TPA: tRNA (adenosine(37)-N6)-threonylcarbamoyltransferase complex ATPase subunit type 1 TsaE [Pyrinomonadaceae bacterium]|nr:tRNA (adenosine(37)-N6)-threonylcarbamoyltransferase complex ATPase subunit type 1 TsaE [Pyrinomonadaceae bacterium]
MKEIFSCTTPEDTFALGERIGASLKPGSLVLLYGGLGAGKTLLTKGIVSALGYDVDEVTSPSFALVNLYKTDDINVYHIDLWRIGDTADAAFAVGLDEILDDPQAIVVIEWAERLSKRSGSEQVLSINIEGSGDEPRTIILEYAEQIDKSSV